MTEEASFEVLKFNNNYEIGIEYPHPIRKIGKTNYITENIDNRGYMRVYLNRHPVYKHKLIALQFIPNHNPETNNEIDHIDRNKLNNTIENLRWCTRSENALNRGKCVKKANEYLDEMPDDVVEIKDYDDFQLRDYYFDYTNERVIKLQRYTNVHKIKVMNPSISNNQIRITLIDINGKSHNITYNKLIRTLKELME